MTITAAEYQFMVEKFPEFKSVTASEKTQSALFFAMWLQREASEVGEVFLNAIKLWAHPDTDDLAEELGDVLWFVSKLASMFGLSLEEIMEANIDKLENRHAISVSGPR
jgi:NTP pyrophosphatase (non-canonical NTP hydrolase)